MPSAYSDGGMARIVEMEAAGEVAPLQFQGWTKVSNSNNGNDQQLVWEGNTDLLQHEQEVILQDILAQNLPLWREATDAFNAIPSPIPGHQSTFEEYCGIDPNVPDDASIASFGARWAWTTNALLPAWQAWDINNVTGIDIQHLLNGGY